MPAEGNWRQFHANWYRATERQSISIIDPKSPSLSLEPLPTNLDPSISSSIFIRESYVTMFTVRAKAIARQGRHRVIIIGQPGTGAYLHYHNPYRVRSILFEGKTLLGYYLFVRLLQRKQVVLFSPDGKIAYLCYDTPGVGVTLPNPIPSSNVFIWSLFGKSQRASWLPVRVFQFRQPRPIPSDTRSGTKNGCLCSPACRYGLAMSSRKGTS